MGKLDDAIIELHLAKCCSYNNGAGSAISKHLNNAFDILKQMKKEQINLMPFLEGKNDLRFKCLHCKKQREFVAAYFNIRGLAVGGYCRECFVKNGEEKNANAKNKSRD